MKKFKLTFILGIFLVLSCNKEKFEPTDVLVGFKGNFLTEELFEFINLKGFDVEYVYGKPYISSLPPDSLKYIKDYLDAMNYTNNGTGLFSTVNLNYKNELILSTWLYNMYNTSNQTDWLKSMEILKLKEKDDDSRFVVKFNVPAGQEKEWVKTFESYNFVEWAELNYRTEVVKH